MNQDPISLNGFVLINKPVGWSSFDVVAKIRGKLKKDLNKKIKVGHTGTLDPLASGLMIIVIGDYCKRASEFSGMDKSYTATLTLGSSSTTDDAEGELTAVSSTKPQQAALQQVLTGFKGVQDQVPPAFSAIKVGGKRAYNMARQGQKFALEPRKVTIYDVELISYQYPEVVIDCTVSSGTYIRSLGRDIGQKLGTGAYLSALVRSSVGPYRLEDAVDPDDYSSQTQLRQVATNL